MIDGYNLLAVTGHKGRDEFLSALSKYRKQKGHDVTVVFDGTHKGTRWGDQFGTAGIHVIFSPITVTADDTMEELLEEQKGSSYVVVSSDREVQRAAQRFGHTFVFSQEFAKRLDFSEAIASSKEDPPPWMEGREEEARPTTKKKGGKKLPKKERQRRRRLGGL